MKIYTDIIRTPDMKIYKDIIRTPDMKIYTDINQGTPEWFAVRQGKFTSSTISDLFMKETTIGYQEAINRVVFERIAGESPETYSNEFMKRGTELEPQAREAYELETTLY